MSRSGSTPRPTHIPLPTAQFQRTDGSQPGSPGPIVSPTSPRNSFIPSFIRNRSRANTTSGRSPRVEVPDPMNRINGGGAAAGSVINGLGRDGGGVTRSVSTPSGGASVGGIAAGNPNPNPTQTIDPKGKTHRIRLVPHLEHARSLAFDPVVREVYPITVHPAQTPSAAAALVTNLGALAAGKPPAMVVKIGRFTDKTPAISNEDRPATGIGGATIAISGGGGEVTSQKIAFKSKVVSRTHAELWCEPGGKFFIRDTSSSSGTFLNHIRLSSPNTDSRPTQLNDGDILQLGVDYQGGHEDQFRCVKMRIELGREWQRAANEFNTNALKQLRTLGGAPVTPDSKGKAIEGSNGSVSKKGKASVTDCCICLFSVTVCQSLFIAPCSHVFHYKCIRPLLQQHHPGFSCPLCRTFANLEEDVEIDDPPDIAASRRTSSVSRRASAHSVRQPNRGVDPISPTTNGGALNPILLDDLAPPISSDPVIGEQPSSGEEGGRAEDDTHLGVTGIFDDPEDVEMASGSYTAPSAMPIRSSSSGSLSALTRGAEARRQAIIASASASRRSSSGMGIDPLETAGIPDVQTPSNNYFLSTLAPGEVPTTNGDMLGVHQQLDQAGGTRSSAFGRQGHEQETTLAGDSQREVEIVVGERRQREESEMMFS